MSAATIVSDLAADPELGWAAEMLATAKNLLLRTGCVPPLFAVIDPSGEWSLLELTKFGDWNDSRNRERITRVLRKACANFRSDRCLLLTDTYYTQFEHHGGLDAAVERINEIGSKAFYQSLSVDERVALGIRLREAIMAKVEQRGRPTVDLVQFYRRDGKTIVFEECEKRPTVQEGRMTNLLGQGEVDG